MPRNRIGSLVAQRLAREEYNQFCQTRAMDWLRSSNVGIGSDYVLRALNAKPKDVANLVLGRYVGQRLQEASLIEKCDEALRRLGAQRQQMEVQEMLQKDKGTELTNDILSLVSSPLEDTPQRTERLVVKDTLPREELVKWIQSRSVGPKPLVEVLEPKDSVFGRGLYARDKIPRGTAVLFDDASFVLPLDSKHCAQCLVPLSNNNQQRDCAVCEGERYCSEGCQEAALQLHHASSCGAVNPILKEWTEAMRAEVSADVSGGKDAKAALLCLAAARLFALSTQSSVHPLQHQSMRPLRGVIEFESNVALHHLGGVVVALSEAFRQPNLHLEELLSVIALISTNMFLLEEGIVLFPVLSLLNHSCTPNCIVVGPTAIHKQLITVADVRPGEQLLIDYNPQLTGSMGYEARKELLAQRHFECFCPKCILRK